MAAPFPLPSRSGRRAQGAVGEQDVAVGGAAGELLVAVASDGWTLDPAIGGVPHPRSYGTFVRVLGHYAVRERVLPLAAAVRKMTALPARRLGLTDRGTIAVGKAADLVVFDPDRVIDRATYERPHAFCDGVSHVIVNGRLVIDEGHDTGTPAGQVLRRPGSAVP
jgi:N-acyl-D-amino-acid deacylase